MTRLDNVYALVVAASSACLAAQALPADRLHGAASVDAEQCSAWLHTLAGPDFAGRGTGQEGYRKAAEFVAAHFRRLGLDARGPGDNYFQHMPWDQSKVTAATLTFSKAGQPLLEIPAERLSGNVSKDTDASGEVVLLNIEVPQSSGRRMPRIDGLDEADVAGKVVVAFVEAEQRTLPFARYAVMRALQGQKAAAIVFANAQDVSGGMAPGAG